jgi:hypothetical protein
MKRTPLVRSQSTTAKLTIRQKKCKACRGKFFPASAWQTFCRSEPCAQAALADATRKRLKREAKEHAAKLADIKPLSYWEKRAEKAVNRYVRARDHFKGCVSCDLPPTWDGQWHASHLRSVAAASAVRYHLWNIHKACSACNNHKSGNVAEYLRRLPERMPQERIDWLYTQNQRAKYTREYLERLASVFNRKALRQERRNAAQF